MSRGATLSALGLYNWDDSIFDLMHIPEALDKNTLIKNLLAETAELEILYPNPVVFKNLVGVWSEKQYDIWLRLWKTTQYEYNPIENYDRMETGSTGGTGTTTRTGTDTSQDSSLTGGSDKRTEAITTGGKDTSTGSREEGGTEGEEGTTKLTNSGSDTVTGAETKGHWVAGFNEGTPSGDDDGLKKQTRDQADADTTTEYGKIEDGEHEKTTTFGKTENTSEEMKYGKTENTTETRNYGQTFDKNGSSTHNETIENNNSGTHELRAHGNIGVTTTQEMIRQERAISLFNIYNVIIEDFKMRFCILVY